MLSLVFTSRGCVELREAVAPSLESEEGAVVRPIASTTCDLDRAIIAGLTPFDPPFAIGHECVAEVIEVGDDAAVSPGEIVVVPWHPCCTACTQCVSGRPSHCERVDRFAMYGTPLGGPMGGLFDDLVHVPFGRALVPVPEGVDPAVVASASDNLTDAYGAVDRALSARPGGTVLVVGGTGSIGQWTAAWGVVLGAARVVYVDPEEVSRGQATGYGAEAIATLQALDDDERFDVVVDASAQEALLGEAMMRLAPGGHCHSVGIYFAPQTGLPLGSLYMTGASFSTGRPNVLADLPHVLGHVAAGRLDPGPVFTDRVSYADLPAVLAELPRKAVASRPPIHGSN